MHRFIPGADFSIRRRAVITVALRPAGRADQQILPYSAFHVQVRSDIVAMDGHLIERSKSKESLGAYWSNSPGRFAVQNGNSSVDVRRNLSGPDVVMIAAELYSKATRSTVTRLTVRSRRWR